MARTKSTARKEPSNEAKSIIAAASGTMSTEEATTASEPKTKRQKTTTPPSTTMYLVLFHESYSSGDPIEPKVVGIYSTKELATKNARACFERHSYYFDADGFNEEANEKLDESEDNTDDPPDNGKMYFELSLEGDQLVVTINKISTDKPCPKTLASISCSK